MGRMMVIVQCQWCIIYYILYIIYISCNGDGDCDGDVDRVVVVLW